MYVHLRSWMFVFLHRICQQPSFKRGFSAKSFWLRNFVIVWLRVLAFRKVHNCIAAVMLLTSIYSEMYATAIPIIIEDHETAFNVFQYQFTTGKPLKNLKPTLNCYGNGSML
jgi:hypothetical protein